jgi:hypothetical protein
LKTRADAYGPRAGETSDKQPHNQMLRDRAEHGSDKQARGEKPARKDSGAERGSEADIKKAVQESKAAFAGSDLNSLQASVAKAHADSGGGSGKFQQFGRDLQEGLKPAGVTVSQDRDNIFFNKEGKELTLQAKGQIDFASKAYTSSVEAHTNDGSRSLKKAPPLRPISMYGRHDGGGSTGPTGRRLDHSIPGVLLCASASVVRNCIITHSLTATCA